MAGVDIRDNHAGIDRLLRQMREMGSHKHVVVGITNAAPGGVLEYANYNEFGARARPHNFRARPHGTNATGVFHTSGIVPSRPFMRTYYDHNIRRIGNFAVNQIMRVVTNELFTLTAAYNAIGLFVQNGIKNQIRTAHQWAEPNSPLTILLKGSAKPLINHGILLNNVTFDIRSR